MVYTSVQAGTCAVSTTPPNTAYPNVTWPGLCPSTAVIGTGGSGGPQFSTLNFTDESNNLNIVQNVANNPSTLAYSTDGNSFLETHYLASADGTCVSNPAHVFVMDNPQDRGSTPSNLGGQAFWESPDIIVVTAGTPVTKNTPPTDPVVEAGTNYDIYVRVHNDFGCMAANNVRARVWWGDAAVSMPTWQDVISNGPDPANPNWSGVISVPAADDNIIGPIHWVAPNSLSVNPHECLLVNIQADNEAAPPAASMAATPDNYQIAQRNVEVGGQCLWALSNGAQASQLGVTLTTTYASNGQTNAGQVYPVGANDTVKVVFDDPGLSLFAAWTSSTNPKPPVGCTVTSQPTGGTAGTGSTTVTLNAGQSWATVSGASLSANESLNVNATVNPAVFSGTTIVLAVAANLTGPGGAISSNGATCSLIVTGHITP
jgi:hypothetical protein